MIQSSTIVAAGDDGIPCCHLENTTFKSYSTSCSKVGSLARNSRTSVLLAQNISLKYVLNSLSKGEQPAGLKDGLEVSKDQKNDFHHLFAADIG